MAKISKKMKSKLGIFKKAEVKKGDNPFVEIFTEHLPKQIVLIAIMVIFVIYVIMNLSNIGSFFAKVINILMPIIIGWILTYLMAPLYDIFVKYFTAKRPTKNKYVLTTTRFARPLATILCTLVVILAAVGLLYLFIPQLYISFSKFLSKAPGYYNNIVAVLENYEEAASDEYSRKVFADIQDILSNFVTTTGDIQKIDLSVLFANVYNGFYFSFKMLLNVFVGLIVMMYSLNLKEEFTNGLKRILYAISRKDIAQKIIIEVRYANKVFSGFLVGKILDSIIIGIICYICCLFMKMPYTPLISVIVGITNIIPFFGPFIGAIPSFAIIILEEPFTWRPWGFLIFILALQQLDGNVIGPKILGDKTGVGSFWVLFSILLFGGLFGFVGMIIAVPLWAIITKLFDEYVVLKLKEKNYPLTTEEYKTLKEYNENLKKASK